MSKITAKNTKDQILEAYNKAQEEIKKLKEGKTSTAEVVKAKEVKEIKTKAKEIIDLGILNNEMQDKYTALLKTVDLLEKEIEELYGIKREADTLEALINASKDKEIELNKRHEARVAELLAELSNKRDEVTQETIALTKKYNKLESELKVEYAEMKAKLDKERAREKEEFDYKLNLDKERTNNSWEEEKAKREKELADKEQVVREREAKVNELEAKIEELNNHISQLNDKIEEVKTVAFKEGKDKAAKEYAIQKSYAEKEAKWNRERLEEKISALEEALANERSAHEVTKGKLDEAYSKVQEIATQTVKANGSVRIVENSKN